VIDCVKLVFSGRKRSCCVSGTPVDQLCQTVAGEGEQALADSGDDPLGRAAAVSLETELTLEGVVDRLDPLAEPTEAAVPGAFVAAVRAQHPHPELADLGFDLASGQTLVRQHRRARCEPPGLHGDGQQVQAHLALAELRIGQTPRDRHPVRGGQQVELESPVVT
jgi:hypothetical protein